jgi:uncharacterized membrane protein
MSGFFRTKMGEALASGQPISAQDKNHAALAHLLGAIVGVFTAGVFFPVMATTVVLLFNSTRHPFVLFHVNQAALFQAFVSGVAILAGVIFGLLYVMTCGVVIFLLPVLLLFALIPWSLSVLLPAWLAYRAYKGEWAGYPVIGDFVLDQASPFVDG